MMDVMTPSLLQNMFYLCCTHSESPTKGALKGLLCKFAATWYRIDTGCALQGGQLRGDAAPAA